MWLLKQDKFDEARPLLRQAALSDGPLREQAMKAYATIETRLANRKRFGRFFRTSPVDLQKLEMMDPKEKSALLLSLPTDDRAVTLLAMSAEARVHELANISDKEEREATFAAMYHASGSVAEQGELAEDAGREKWQAEQAKIKARKMVVAKQMYEEELVKKAEKEEAIKQGIADELVKRDRRIMEERAKTNVMLANYLEHERAVAAGQVKEKVPCPSLPPTLSVQLSVSLSVSISLSHSLCLNLSVSFSLSHALSHSLCLIHSVSISLSQSLCLILSVSLSVSLVLGVMMKPKELKTSRSILMLILCLTL